MTAQHSKMKLKFAGKLWEKLWLITNGKNANNFGSSRNHTQLLFNGIVQFYLFYKMIIKTSWFRKWYRQKKRILCNQNLFHNKKNSEWMVYDGSAVMFKL